jgi:hypothetical protein
MTAKLTTKRPDFYSPRKTSMDESPSSTCGDGLPWTSVDSFG